MARWIPKRLNRWLLQYTKALNWFKCLKSKYITLSCAIYIEQYYEKEKSESALGSVFSFYRIFMLAHTLD
jgi:hypothetical protein